MRSAGSAVKVTLPGDEEKTLCTGGKIGARQYFIENPEYFEEVRQACYNISGLKPSSPNTTISEPDSSEPSSEEESAATG